MSILPTFLIHWSKRRVHPWPHAGHDVLVGGHCESDGVLTGVVTEGPRVGALLQQDDLVALAEILKTDAGQCE